MRKMFIDLFTCFPICLRDGYSSCFILTLAHIFLRTLAGCIDCTVHDTTKRVHDGIYL